MSELKNKNIYFYDNSLSLSGLELNSFDSNPGIGGSQFVLMQLISELAEYDENRQYTLITEQVINSICFAKNIKIQRSSEYIDQNSTHIVTFAQLEYLLSTNVRGGNLIIWSHHPHDMTSKGEEITKRFRKINYVSIGEYQYDSNWLRFGKHYRIKNLPPRRIPTNNYKTFRGNFVFLGSFTPAKGLHLILENWPKIISILPTAQLHVVGGDIYANNLYGGKIALESERYIEKINKIVNNYTEITKKSVIFHGKLNAIEKNKVLSNCDVALLNPTGASEAYPASALECLSYSVQVVAGGDYGMRDIMSKFDGLNIINWGGDYVKLINSEIMNDKIYASNKQKSFDFYLEYFNSREHIIISWLSLIDEKLEKQNRMKNSFIESIIIDIRSSKFMLKKIIKKILK